MYQVPEVPVPTIQVTVTCLRLINIILYARFIIHRIITELTINTENIKYNNDDMSYGCTLLLISAYIIILTD